jgi:nicotinamide mononucleotide transporter
MSGVEIAGVLTGVLAIWLTTRQKIWCWPLNMVSALLFVVVFYRARLYGAMGLQFVYVGLSAYGWYAWTRGSADEGPLRVSRIPRRVLATAAAAGILLTWGLWWWLSRRTNEALPFVDAATTGFSLVAQWMQTRKWIENWPLWVVVDLAYVGMNLSQGLLWTAALYAGFCVLAILGFREWRRALVES